jgi:tRNA(fMet)-specific endonuclease VapC
MAGNCLLDTSIIVAILRKEPSLQERLAGVEGIFVPSTVLGELYYGARISGRTEENLRQIDEFVAGGTFLDCDADTSRQYSQIKNELRMKGRPIPENDIWIAATARQYDLILVTRDAHFGEVDGLIVETW